MSKLTNAKVCLLGESGVGKTCLVQRFARAHYEDYGQVLLASARCCRPDSPCPGEYRGKYGAAQWSHTPLTLGQTTTALASRCSMNAAFGGTAAGCQGRWA